MVIIPDYYRGKLLINPMTAKQEDAVKFVKNKTQWEGNLKVDWEEKIQPYALQHGAKTFGAIGEILKYNTCGDF